MSTNSAIEWTEATWNPVSGCTRVSAGCDNCYAVTMTNRLEAMGQAKYKGLTVLNPAGDRHFNGVVRCDEEALTIPLRWKKPRRIFVNSMADLFHRDVPFDFIDKVFAVMALCSQHTFQILTKRPERMAEYTTSREFSGGMTFLHVAPFGEMTDAQCDAIRRGVRWPLPNVWLGTSCENQKAADERIPHLLKCPAAVRFLSLEPLLDPVDLDRAFGCGDSTHKGGGSGICDGVDWIIAGGESGPGARPCNIDWIRYIVRQCKEANCCVFVKQLGAWPTACLAEFNRHPANRLNLKDKKGGDMSEWPEDLCVRQMPK